MNSRILRIALVAMALDVTGVAQDLTTTVTQDPAAGTVTYMIQSTPPPPGSPPILATPFPAQSPLLIPFGGLFVPLLVPGNHWVLHTLPPMGPPVPLFLPPLDDASNDVILPFAAPDAQSLFVTQFRQNGTSVIRRVDVNGTDLGVVVDHGARTGCSPAASTPSGDRLFFSSNHDGDFEIYSTDLNGGNETKLTNNSLLDAGPAPKGDGSKIAFSRVDPFQPGVTQIWLMDFDGSNQVMVTNPGTPGIKAPFSWNGSNILYTSNEAGDFDIYMIDENGQGKTLLSNTPGDHVHALPIDLCGFPEPDLQLVVADRDTILGQTTDFTLIGAGTSPTANYTWFLGDGTLLVTTTPSVNHVYAQTGDFPVTVFVSDPPHGIDLIETDVVTVFDPQFPGTGDDIRLFTGIDATPDPLDVKPAFPGQILGIDFDSPFGTYFDDPYLVAGQLFLPGQPPVNAIPGLHLNLFGMPPFILVDGLNPLGPLPPPPIFPGGNLHTYLIPPGLGGLDLMLQALVLTPNSGNGFLAASDGKVISFQ